jgi:hypothetical protein
MFHPVLPAMLHAQLQRIASTQEKHADEQYSEGAHMQNSFMSVAARQWDRRSDFPTLLHTQASPSTGKKTGTDKFRTESDGA